MSKLHEILAVKNNVVGQATKAMTDLKETFSKKRHLFGSKIVTFIPSEEGAVQKTEEQSDIQTTVRKELDWLSDLVKKAIDNDYLIDEANTSARASIVLEDGRTILENVSATALLALEGKIIEVKGVVETIPTLDPAKGFRPDDARGHGIYQARTVETTRTKKIKKVLPLAPATKEHPAQVTVYDADEPVGTLQSQEWSSLLTPADKADMLDRCDILLRAVRAARARANEFEVSQNPRVGNKLLEYIFKG